MVPDTASAGASTASDVLVADNIVGGYTSELDILHGVSLHLREREIVAIIGPNGAGKSTLVKALFGLVKVRSGAARLRGDDITNERPNRLVARGMAYVPQRENIFPALSVRENLEVGGFTVRRRTRERIDDMYRLFPRLRERSSQAAGTLSGGERQMVALARALMPAPDVLLLDEPSAGLAPMIVQEVFDTIARIRDEQQIAVLLVEQNARKALAMSDRGYVLDMGRDAITGTGDELMNDPKVIELYLGGAAADVARKTTTGPPEGGPVI